jgi:DNA ligase (NAD+)
MDYKSLKKIVMHHDKLYYDEGRPVLSDEEYDSLFDQLVDKETLQGWKDSDSPTIRVNAAQGKVNHPHRLYSLNKVYNEEDIDSRFSIVTPKLDGVNLSVTYKDTYISLLLTRGDGEKGESVAHLSRVIKGIPTIIEKESLTIVGEVVTDNTEVENFRNYVAGALGLKSAVDAKEKNLRFIAHDVLGVEMDYLDRMALAESFGFTTVVSDEDFSKYPQDGIVYRVPTHSLEKELGHTSKHPKFAVALKQKEHYSAATHLQEIVWAVGRSGVVTPIGIVDPVQLDGATVSRVVLHNIEFIEEHNLGAGDSILIERRITPQFVRVLEHSPYPRHTIEDVVRQLGVEVYRKGPKLYVSESDAYRQVEYFVKTLEIKGLGPQSIRKLEISHPTELFGRDDWDELGKNGEKIEAELTRPKEYYKVLAALGIPGVGKNTAKLIVSHIPKFEDLHKVAHTGIKGIGEKTVENILTWLEFNEDWVYGLPYSLEAEELESDIMDNRKVCITGKLDMTKKQLSDHLAKFGIQVSNSLTKDCYALISSGEPSSKIDKAEKYGIPVFNYWNNRSQILKGTF